MKKIRALIIDDEQHCIDTLRYDLYIACGDMVDIVGDARDVIAAAQLIQQQSPELIFLDMELAGSTGLELLEMIDRSRLKIIFTTAHSEYAVKAYKYKAEAYLLKPIDVDELKQEVEAVMDSIAKENPSEMLKGVLQLPDVEGMEFIKYGDILYLKADDNYVMVYLEDGSIKTASKTLKFIESKLPIGQFVRIHHSYIINIKYLKKYRKIDGGEVELKGGITIPVSKKYKERLLSLIS